MTPILLALALVPVAYSYDAKTKVTYDVGVQFEGYLPVMGGNEGKVDVKMAVGVEGKAKVNDNLAAASEIQEFEVSFNGAKLPLDKSNVVDYFPKTNIVFTPAGKILTSDAPDRKLPIRLPGLDVKHFPDITYVPIELPVDGLEVGREWTFQRDFGGAPIDYSCKAESMDSGTWKIKVALKQSYNVLEDSSIQVVTKKEDAVSEVTTTMTGEGMIEFNNVTGLVAKADMKNSAVSDVRNLSSGETKQRKLTTTYSVKIKTDASSRTVKPVSNTKSWWETAQEWGNNAIQTGRGAFVWIQTAAVFGLDTLPAQFKSLQPYLRRFAPWLKA